MNKTVAKISYSEYKDIFLNNKCLRHLMNRTKSKNHERGTYAINKISFPCFGDKINRQNNRYDGLALGYYN